MVQKRGDGSIRNRVTEREATSAATLAKYLLSFMSHIGAVFYHRQVRLDLFEKTESRLVASSISQKGNRLADDVLSGDERSG